MHKLTPLTFVVLFLLSALAWTAGTSAMAQAGGPGIYVYVSVGDNQWVSQWPPIDSPATIEAMFDWLSRTYHVKRIYWRGEQDRMWLEHFQFRPENPLYYDFWNGWLRYLTDTVKTDDRAVPCDEQTAISIHRKYAPPFPR